MGVSLKPIKDGGQYSGTDNLEVMAEAENYNGYLLGLLRKHLAGARLVLDFGAGLGVFARALAESGFTLLCLEPDRGQAARISELGLATCAALEEVPEAHLDAIYSLNVLEHIRDDQSALDDLFSRLKPGGRLLIYVPAFQLLYSSMDRKVGHFRRYRRQALIDKLCSARFIVAEARYVDSLGFLAALAYKALGSRRGEINRGSLRAYDRYVFPVSVWLDRLVSRWLGKNLLVVAVRPKD